MARKRNCFNGWSSYRHGERKQPITLGGRKPKQIIRGDKRAHVVDSIAALLKTFKLTPFEREGACLHGLRSALCLEGHRWPLADIEATGIVAEALRRIGAERPTWDQGQREYAVPRENCKWCARPLPEGAWDGGLNKFFCSPECARSAFQYRDFEDGWKHDAVATSAYRLVRSEKNEQRACEGCGKLFRLTFATKDTRFCSSRCAYQSMRTRADRTCPICNATFRPRTDAQLYCSRACIYEGFKARDTERACEWCGGTFMANRDGVRFCTNLCGQQARRVMNGRVKTISPPVFDYIMRRPASGFACEAVATAESRA